MGSSNGSARYEVAAVLQVVMDGIRLRDGVGYGEAPAQDGQHGHRVRSAIPTTGLRRVHTTKKSIGY